MLYREIIAVCSQIHTKHISTLCGQDEESANVKPGGKYSDLGAVEGYNIKNNILRLSSYRTINTLPLSYKNQSVNVV
jgi:hypothetical protein